MIPKRVGSSAPTAASLPTGIDAAKIGGGAVSNTEFGYLDGVTSSIQGQIDSATSLNTPNRIVSRDANGDFLAGVITANALAGVLNGFKINSAPDASSLGTVVKRVAVQDADGNTIGYLPVYDAIT